MLTSGESPHAGYSGGEMKISLHSVGLNRPSVPGFRCEIIMLALVGLVLAGPCGAQDAKKSKTGGASQTLKTKQTQFPIRISYYKSAEGKESPAVILLHDRDGNRQIWKPVAEKLQEEGYAVVSVDLRGHGESTGESEDQDTTKSKKNKSSGKSKIAPPMYKLMVIDDLEAVKAFLLQEHHDQNLNVRKTGIIAIGMSAPIAMNFAANDWLKKPYNDAQTGGVPTPRGQDVRALLLISPDASLPGLSTLKPSRLLRGPKLNVSFQIYAGVEDEDAKKNADRIYRQVAINDANKARMEFKRIPSKLNGVDLLGRRHVPFMSRMFLAFLDKHLDGLDDKWVNRKSRQFRNAK